jgi:hypothetical protein
MSMPFVAACALSVVAGCGGEPDGQTDLAKLPPPSQDAIDRAKKQAPPKALPRFGSPPRAATANP